MHLHLHPKIAAALVAAVLVALVTIGNQIVSVYGNDWWTPILAALIPVLAGYQKSA